MQIVTITVKNDNPNNVVANVSVSIYNQASAFVTSGTTNNSGIVTFNLNEETYNSYYYKQGFSLAQPISLVVSPSSKNFVVTGHIKQAAESLDNNLIVVSGYIYDIQGKNEKVRLTIEPIAKNIITNSLIFMSPVKITSDEKGYFEFYLLRNTEYNCFLEGFIESLLIKTPQLASIELFNLLFPLPLTLTLSQTSISIPFSAGQNSSITYTLLWSDQNYKKMSNDWANIEYTVSDPSLVEVRSANDLLVLTPLKTGSGTVTFTRKINKDYIWSNPPTFTAPTLTITIT